MNLKKALSVMNSLLTSMTARLVIAHRGNAAHAPENTLESFDQAVGLGVDAIEFDVHITRDGIPVVIHDATLERTTQLRGPVSALTVAQLREANAGWGFSRDRGRTFPYRQKHLGIPTVEEVVRHFTTTPLLIEVKVPEAAGPLGDVLDAAGATPRAVFGSMSLDAITPFRARGLPTGAASSEVIQLLLPALLRRRHTHRLPYEAMCIPRWYNGIPVPVGALARLGRLSNVVTHVWTVDSPTVAKRLWRKGVQGIVTNDPRTMLGARRELANSAR